MSNYLNPEYEEEVYLGSQDYERNMKRAYAAQESLYRRQTGRDLTADVNKYKSAKEEEEGSLMKGVASTLEFLFTPLTAPAAALQSMLAEDRGDLSAEFEAAGRAAWDRLTHPIRMAQGEDPDYTDYARQVVDRFAPDAGDKSKTAMSFGLELLLDPLVMLGFPKMATGLGMLRKGIRKTAINADAGVGLTQAFEGAPPGSLEALASMSIGKGAGDEARNVIAMARKADKSGNKGDVRAFLKAVNDSPEFRANVETSTIRELTEQMTAYEAKDIGVDSGSWARLDKTSSIDDVEAFMAGGELVLRRGTFNIKRVPNINALKDHPELEKFFIALDRAHDKDFTNWTMRHPDAVNINAATREKAAAIYGIDPSRLSAKEQFLSTAGMYTLADDAFKYARRFASTGDALDRDLFIKQMEVMRLYARHHRRAASEAGRSLRNLRGDVVAPAVKKMAGDDTGNLAEEYHKLFTGAVKLDAYGARTIDKLADMLIAADGRPDFLVQALTKGDHKTEGAFANAVFEYFTNNILSGPGTHAVNLTSTVSRIAMEPLIHGMASIGALARFNGADAARHFWSMTDQITGLFIGMREAFQLGARNLTGNRLFKGLDGDMPASTNIDLIKQRLDPSIDATKLGLTGWAGDVVNFMGKVIRLPGNALMAEDQFMKTIAYRMNVHATARKYAARAKAEGTKGSLREIIQRYKKNPIAAQHKEGVKAAHVMVFQEKLGPLGQKGHTFIRSFPGLRYLMPFVQTPTNLVKQGIQHTPFAVFRRNGIKELTADTALGDLARARVAFGTAAAGGLMTAMGDGISGRIDRTTPEGRHRLMFTQEYSFQIGNEGMWVDYSRIEPLRFILGSAANVKDILTYTDPNDPDDAAIAKQAVDALVLSFFGTATDNYMAGPLSDIFQMVHSASKGDGIRAMKLFNDIGTAFFPNIPGATGVPGPVPTGQLFAQWARQRDGYFRVADGFIDKLVQKTMGLSSTLPAYRNAYGEKVRIPMGMGPETLNPLWRSMFQSWDPMKHSYREADPIDKAMMDLQIGVGPYIKRVRGVKLKHEEMDLVNKWAGQGWQGVPSIKARIAKVMNSNQFAGLQPQTQRVLIERMFTQMRQAAIRKLIMESPELREKIQAIQFHHRGYITQN